MHYKCLGYGGGGGGEDNTAGRAGEGLRREACRVSPLVSDEINHNTVVVTSGFRRFSTPLRKTAS